MNWETVEELQLIMLLRNEFDYEDPWFLREFLGFINLFNPTSLVETGTYKGDMIRFLAKVYPDLKIFSCDVMDVSEVKKYFDTRPNIYIEQSDSVKFLKKLLKPNNELGNLPFFFLDAHSAMAPNYPKDVCLEPLAEEIKIVADYKRPCLVCIHDFKVPGIPEFGHGSRDGFLKKVIKIEFSVIEGVVRNENVKIFFPTLPHRLLQKSKINWTTLFNLRGRIYLLFNMDAHPHSSYMKALEAFGILRRFDEPN